MIAATQLRAGNAASARAAVWLAAEAIATRALATRTGSQGGEIVLRADSAVGPDGSAHPRISPRSQRREDRASDIHPWIKAEARQRHQPSAAVAGHTAWVDVGRTGGTFLRALTV
jgi:hypothetical protein